MTKSEQLEELFSRFLREVPDLLATFVVDFDGFIFAKKLVKEVNEDLITAIIASLDQTLNRIKSYTETKIGSGSFDTDEFRLFYIELGDTTNAILLIIGKSYSSLENYIPYSHIIADKVSLILNNREIPIEIPGLNENGDLKLKSKSKTITFIGSENVGKTTLIAMYNNNRFEKSYIPTIGISMLEKEIHYDDGYKLILNIFDLGGIKSFAKVRKQYYKYSDIVLIVFDYSRMDTLHDIKGWIKESTMFLNSEIIPYILVGNKIDLAPNRDKIRDQAIKLSEESNLLFFETSCLTGEGISNLFDFLTVNSTKTEEEKISVAPISDNEIQNLTEEDKTIFMSLVSCDTVDDCKIPNIIEKNIFFNIVKNKEISLSKLLISISPMEKALNRKIDKEQVLTIVDKFIKNGQVEKLYLNFNLEESYKTSSKSIHGEYKH